MEVWGVLNMGNMVYATIFVISLNVLMWFTQIAMYDINPEGPVMYTLNGSPIGATIQEQGNLSILKNDVTEDLPSSAGTVVTTDSNTGVFTDIFNNILGWMKTAPGIKYAYGVISAPYNILKALNLPNEFVVGIGTLWYLVTLLVLVSFFWGRD